MASRAKDWILNLNQYRNTYFRTLNNVKINYKKAMQSQIAIGPAYKKIACIYTVYPRTKSSFDLGNVCCIHQKFFEDAFVELGKLPDDNIHHIPLAIYQYGHVDKDNPRVDIDVVDLENEGLEKVINLVYNNVNNQQKGDLK